jgi:monoterpene epsilon-lactone hydrolase
MAPPSPQFERVLTIQAELGALLATNPERDELRVRWAQINPFPIAADLEVEMLDAGGVSSELIHPPGADEQKLIVYWHQGAFVMGSAAEFRGPIGELGRLTGAHVLVPDYRLAPEHRFPAAIEDAVSAYRWALEQGYDPARIAFAGDSAGGNLTVTVMLAAREAGLELPAAGVSLSAWFDMESVGATFKTNAEADPVIDLKGNLAMAEDYLGPGGDRRDPLANPLFADLAGLPPIFLRSGSREVLLSDAERIAQMLTAAGVEVDWEPAAGMVHGWYLYMHFLPEARQTMAQAAEFLRLRLEKT